MNYNVVISIIDEQGKVVQYYKDVGNDLVELSAKLLMIYAQIERKNKDELYNRITKLVNDDIPFWGVNQWH